MNDAATLAVRPTLARGVTPELNPQERDALSFAAGVLEVHAGDEKLPPQVRATFAVMNGRISDLLTRTAR